MIRAIIDSCQTERNGSELFFRKCVQRIYRVHGSEKILVGFEAKVKYDFMV